MALTISIEGKGVIANADASPDSAMAGSAWDELGGGADSFSPDTYLYGSKSFAGAYSRKKGFQYYDIGSANTLDFTAGTGTESGQFIYLWVNCPTLGLLETVANKGLAVRIGSSQTDYKEYVIGGSDDSNDWLGEWKCFVIDPTKATTTGTGAGTFDISSVRYMGIWIETASLAKGDNIFISQISVGNGLRITGTSTTAIKDVVDYCTDYPNRAWGTFLNKDGIYFAQTKIWVGDATNQAANVSFSDTGRIIQYINSQYWSGTAWVTTYPTTGSGIIVEDHASYTTTFNDGVAVGTEDGRSGSTIVGNSDQDVILDLYGGNNTGSVTTLYGTVIKSISGQINSGNDAQHKFFSCSFLKSSQFDPVGAPVIKNCTFAETTDVDASLLWNENIDIQNCNFIANSLGAAVEHPSSVGTPYTHTSLLYSGNTKDVLNSSGNAITITKSGNPASDPSTSEGSAVTFQSSLTITITVQDTDTDPLTDILVAVYKLSDRSEIMNEVTIAGGIASEIYVGATPIDVEIRCRKASSGSTAYKNFSTLATLSSDFGLLVTMQEDSNNNATT